MVRLGISVGGSWVKVDAKCQDKIEGGWPRLNCGRGWAGGREANNGWNQARPPHPHLFPAGPLPYEETGLPSFNIPYFLAIREIV